MRGGPRRYFKIPPVIDHQARSFLVDRLRLLVALLMPLHWRRYLLFAIFIIMAASAFVLSGGTQSIFTATFPKQTNAPMPGTTRDAAPNTAPEKTDDATKLQAQLGIAEEKLRYTERKLAAALAQLRDGTPGGEADQFGRRAALLLALGTGRPYQALLRDIDSDWLASEDMALLRRYERQGFYDANHLARRLSALLKGDTRRRSKLPTFALTSPQNLPPALAWLARNAGGLVEVRPQALARVADARHDILTALLADRPATALHLVDEILAGKSDAPSALRDWRDDLAVWRTLSPVMARFRDAHAGNAQNARETE